MADIEDIQQESVKAEVSKVICTKLRNSIRRRTITELDAGRLGSNPGSNAYMLWLDELCYYRPGEVDNHILSSWLGLC